MHDEKLFWQWFEANNEALTMIGEKTDGEQQELLDRMQQQLDQYCEGLSFEMSDPTPSGRTITFSAEGDVDLFRYLLQLTDNAPDFDWWEFVPFKQPKGKDLRVTFDKFHFETSKMFFMQLESEEEPDMLGIRVALPNPVRDDDQLVGVYVTIEALIGEFDYLDTCPIPKDPLKEGFRPMDDLPDFIEWFKNNRDRE